MKFKLKKTDQLYKFQLFNKIEKLKLSTRENKAINADSLVFYVNDNSLYVYISNGISSSTLYLCQVEEEFEDFAVDCNTFTNAFANFPTDEVQFAFIKEENQLVFGNKKTRVSLKTSKANNFIKKIEDEFFVNDDISFGEYDLSTFSNAIKFTSFACAPDFEEHPYSSIMFFIKNKKFNAQSSDKHRISIYGSKFDNDQSYLINKNQAELSLLFVDKMSKFAIYKNKLVLNNNSDYFCTSLEFNTFQSVYNGFQKFFDSSELLTTISVSKNDFVKSLKFVSNISGSHLFNLQTKGTELIFSGSSDNTGGAADRIDIGQELYDLKSSYLTNHFLKVLEIIQDDTINLEFYEINSFIICILRCSNFKHMLFPMN